jgi:hypothetical protein
MELDLLERLLSPGAARRFDRGDSGIEIVIDIHTAIYEREQRHYRSRNQQVPKRFADISRADPSDHPGKTLVQELRRRLLDYYARPDADDPIIIEIPKDTYKPRITDKRGREYALTGETRRTTATRPRLTPNGGPELDDRQIAQAFDEFFGNGISDHKHDGVIIVQSNLMDDLLQNEDARAEIRQSASRLYKARTWACAWDIVGATTIQQEFQRHGKKAPRLILSDHRAPDTSYLYVAFKISMGLGFTDETIKAIEDRTICGKWLHISKASGDAVSLHKRLLPARHKKKTASRLHQLCDDKRQDFRRLFPSDWGPEYVDSWFRMLPPHNEAEVRDYAVIFRHTRLQPHRQVLFVVAGFTERSTALAAQYLVQNWQTLWQTHVRGHAERRSRGDFLILIEGPSDPAKVAEWSEDKDFQVTPEKLRRKGILCDWADRIPDRG